MARLGADGPERPSGLSYAPVPRWKGTDSFWSGDGDEPPHVYVDHGSKSVKIWLETLKVAYNDGYALHEVNAILNIVERDREQLSRAWHEHFGDSGMSILAIDEKTPQISDVTCTESDLVVSLRDGRKIVTPL